MKIAVLSSGGIDSTVLGFKLAKEGNDVYFVFVKAGHPWEEAELIALRKILNVTHGQFSKNTYRIQGPKVLSLPMADVYNPKDWSLSGQNVPGYHAPDTAVEITGRNIVLLSKTAIYCALEGIQAIAMGSLSGNPFPDATSEFFKLGSTWFSMGLRKKIEILTPFRELSKTQVIRIGVELGLPLELTLTCNNPQQVSPGEWIHCGNCNKCAERIHGFKMAGVEDKTHYRLTLNIS
jgi:7-cyano-7-deazaguanine synthase